MTEFKVGDVVWLKSGSPAMCVEGVGTPGFVNVVWAPADGGEHFRDTLRDYLLTEQRVTFVEPIVRRAAPGTGFNDMLRY